MRRAFQLAVLALVLSYPAWATWTVVQHKINTACSVSSATCAITVASTGTGNVIVVGMTILSNVQAIVSVAGGGTYVHPAGCNSIDSTVKGTDCAYTLASTSGATTITVTRTSTTSFTWVVSATELSFTSGPVSVDTGTPQIRDQSSTSTSPAVVAFTPAGSNDAVYQVICGSAPTAISAPYTTSDFQGAAGFGTALNQTSSAAANWTQSLARAAVGMIAFTETGGAVTPKRLTLLGVGF